MAQFTHNELLKDFEQAIQAIRKEDAEVEPDTFTTVEYYETRGISEYRATKDIRAGIKAGLIEPIKSKRTNVHGVIMPLPAYKIVREETPAESA